MEPKVPLSELAVKLEGKKKPVKVDTYLAIQRTYLANDSTFCTFIGVSLGSLGIGLHIISDTHIVWMLMIGWVLTCVLCPAILIFAWRKYRRLHTDLTNLTHAADKDPEDKRVNDELQKVLVPADV